jgi:hypothetical protein
MDRKFVSALSTYGEQLERIAELEQENDRLRGLAVKLAREGFDEVMKVIKQAWNGLRRLRKNGH